MGQNRTLAECMERLSGMEHYSQTDFAALIERVGEEHVVKRLNAQLDLYDRHRMAVSGGDLRWSRLLFPQLVETVLRFSGLLSRTRRNARHPVVETPEVFLENLPEAFEH